MPRHLKPRSDYRDFIEGVVMPAVLIVAGAAVITAGLLAMV